MAAPPPAIEAQWLSRAQGGDMHAFAQLVRCYQSPVRRQLASLTRGDAARADDIAQQAFVQAWRHLDSFRGDARLGTWLHRVAYRCFLQDLREQRREPPSSASGTGIGPDPADVGADPAAGQSLRIDLERALDRLPEAERVAIVHCFHLDLSHEEAAEVLNLPLGTLKSHVARGKARLREWLADWRPEKVT